MNVKKTRMTKEAVEGSKVVRDCKIEVDNRGRFWKEFAALPVNGPSIKACCAKAVRETTASCKDFQGEGPARVGESVAIAAKGPRIVIRIAGLDGGGRVLADGLVQVLGHDSVGDSVVLTGVRGERGL